MLHITPIYAGLLGLLFVALSSRVIFGRFETHTTLGDGGHASLSKRIRVQANAAEYIPLGLILLATAELQGASALWLHLFGAALFAGRVAHAIGLGATPQITALRSGGMVLTFAALVGLSALCLVLALR